MGLVGKRVGTPDGPGVVEEVSHTGRSSLVLLDDSGVQWFKTSRLAIRREAESLPDPVDHPAHYTAHPSGVECIQITEHMGFCLGNAVKYIWRAGEKGNVVEDLRKARWYLDREITRLEGERS